MGVWEAGNDGPKSLASSQRGRIEISLKIVDK